jgi:hypothetical protein
MGVVLVVLERGNIVNIKQDLGRHVSIVDEGMSDLFDGRGLMIVIWSVKVVDLVSDGESLVYVAQEKG